MVHKIELKPFADFPGRVIAYAAWQELHAALSDVVGGKQVAMEISPDDAVPYLDRVPYGVVELIRRLGGTVWPFGRAGHPVRLGWSRRSSRGTWSRRRRWRRSPRRAAAGGQRRRARG